MAIWLVTVLVPCAGMLEAGSAWALPSSTSAPDTPSKNRPSTACTTSGNRLGLATSKVTASVRPVPPRVRICALFGVMVGGLGLAHPVESAIAPNRTQCRGRCQGCEDSMLQSSLARVRARRAVTPNRLSAPKAKLPHTITAADELSWPHSCRETVAMSFRIYLIGIILVVAGLVYAAAILSAPPQW